MGRCYVEGRNAVMLKWMLIAAGGSLGSVLRYALQGWIQRLSGGMFPNSGGQDNGAA